MRIGVPTEVKIHEYRVAATPAGVRELVSAGHDVVVQRNAGEGSSISDDDFTAAGAKILDTADAVWESAGLVLKVKEPIAEEYHRMRGDQMLFTYLHLAASQECTRALMAAGTTSIAYETVQLPDGSLPLLFPMSEVAGRLAPLVGAQCLTRVEGGRGVLIGGVSGVAPARVVIIGAGVSGMNAVAVAAGTWADIVLFDSSRQPVAAGWCQHCLGRPHAWPDRGGPWHRMDPPRGGPGASLTGIGRRATRDAERGGRGAGA